MPHSGTDLAAQQARAHFAAPVDFSWYGGTTAPGYSVLSPWVMSALGVALTGVVAAVLGAVLLAGFLGTVPASLLGATFVVADVASGRVTFALGLVVGLAAVRWRSGALAVLTALVSPVAAVFVAVAGAVLVLHRLPRGGRLVLGALVPTGLIGWLLGDGGVQPFPWRSALLTLAVLLAVGVLTNEPLVRTACGLLVVAVVVLALSSDPFGSNVQRLPLLLAGPVLLAMSRWRLMPLGLVGCLVWQLAPLQGDLSVARIPMAAVTAELRSLGSVRAEVVAPRDHADVTTGLLLARGWARQVDVGRNPLFYKGTLTAPAYVAWLHDNAVDHVALPRHGSLDIGATREAALLRTPIKGVSQVWHDADWTVWRVDGAQPLVPGLVSASRRGLVVAPLPAAAAAPGGRRVVRIHWNHWLSLEGEGCIEPDGRWVSLTATERVTITSSWHPRGHC
ncbi:MAG: putative integral rane protein [Frankiales bacterium]|nr:putative integral rane protein [Frankiales bacterium]